MIDSFSVGVITISTCTLLSSPSTFHMLDGLPKHFLHGLTTNLWTCLFIEMAKFIYALYDLVIICYPNWVIIDKILHVEICLFISILRTFDLQ